MKITIEGFTGIAPKFGVKNLPNNAAQMAENVRLESGEIRPLNINAPIAASIQTGATSIYPLGGPVFTYLSWVADVDVARSPLADDESRIYYTGDGVPKKTYLALASAGAGPYPDATTGWLHLGVPKPTAMLSVVGTGSGTITETRVYVYTFVTMFGAVVTEESAPSKPATVTLTNNSAAEVSNILDPGETTNYSYAKKRLYRSVGEGAFTLVAEIALGVTTFTDNLTTVPGDLLLSTDWAPPPVDLKGLTLLPGGVLAGFRNNEIWFSEPDFPHAWPPKYMQTVNAKVVAIRCFGNNLAVVTEAYPEIGSGLSPDSFTFAVVPLRAPAVSKRSMAGDESGVIYASDAGLVALGNGGTGLATKDVLTRYEFAAFNPSSMLGVTFDRKYYGFYRVGPSIKALLFQSADNPPLSTASLSASAVAVEPITNKLVILDPTTGKLAYVDPLDTQPMSFQWRSKVFELPFPMNFAAAKLTSPDATGSTRFSGAQIAAYNLTVTAFNLQAFAAGKLGSTLNEPLVNATTIGGSNLRVPLRPTSDTFTVYVYASGSLVYSQAVAPQQIFRLPAGFKARSWEVAVAGQRPLQRIEMATSAEELSA